MVGVCLSSGGAKGLVHIGVLKEFEKHEINISQITGTSMGALIGGIYAYTKDIKALEEFALGITKFKWYKTMLFDLKLCGDGFLSGKGVMKLIDHLLPKNAKIEDCKIPFLCIAVDIVSGKEVVFKKGDLRKAIRASISLPMIFQTVKDNQYKYVDGTCLNPAPVDHLDKKFFLVATCNQFGNIPVMKLTKAGIMHTYSLNSTNALIRRASEKVWHTLWTNVDDVDTLEFWKAKQCIKEGERVARDFFKF